MSPAICAALAAALSVWLAVGRWDGLRRLRPVATRVRPAAVRWRRPSWLGTRAQERAERQVAGEVPLVCDLLAVCLETGLPLRGALRAVAGVAEGATREVLDGVVNQIDLGVPEPEAWRSLGSVAAYRLVARDLSRSVDAGTALGEVLRQRAMEARLAETTTLRARARRVSVTGVLPMVVCYLPAFLLVGVLPILLSAFARALLGH